MAREKVLLEARVEDLTHDGCGVVKVDGKVYFVNGVLPEEQIRFIPGKKRKGKHQGELETILDPSGQRIEPECEYFGICGGCALQHAKSASQLKFKEKILFDNLERIGRVKVENIIPSIQGKPWHYRRKARLGIKYVPKKGGILVGFRERSSSFITSLMHCKTLDTRIADLLPALHELLSGMSQNNRIPQIEVAVGDNEIALVLRHLEPLSPGDFELLTEFATNTRVSMYSQSAGPDSITPIWPESPGLLKYRLENFDLNLEFGPMDFTQVNSEVNQLMVSLAVTYIDPQPADKILDLFCGLGNFTLALGRSGAHVVGIEGDAPLVARGTSNAKLNKLENVSFQNLNLHSEGLTQKIENQRFNKMLLDPPRSGAFDVVSDLVPVIRPEKLVYISCNPATLARDADVMVNLNGYRLTHAGVIDMFPHTAHVESMAVFER